MKKKILIAAGAVMIILAVIMGIVLTLPLSHEKVLEFESNYKGKPVKLQASYFEVPDAEYGALICPGYSCDRQKLRAVAALFVKNGISVMTFDYSGQGSSKGTIGFDNAKSDAISEEIADAMDLFYEVSGISYEKMILTGHSMGGRSILRLLYDYNDPSAVTNIEKRPLGYAVLMAPEVNYNFNAQAGLFAGTSDAEEEPWKSFNESLTEGTDIYLYGSTGDDIVTDADILDIYRHLGGTDAPASGVFSGSTVNGAGSKITVETVFGVLHSFQFFDVTFAKMLNDAVTDITGMKAVYGPGSFALIYASWILVSVGAMLILMALSEGEKWNAPDEVPEITDVKKFLVRKALYWIPGIFAAFLVCCVCVCLPFGSPLMNAPYMCFIAGYGLLMLFLYRKGRFAGTGGRLPKPTLKIEVGKKDILSGIITVAILSLSGWAVLRASVYRLFPWNFRLVWLLFAGALMNVGYYVSGVEQDMLEKAGAGRKARFLYGLINYFPLFLFIGFYLAIGSYSGLVQQAINVALLYMVFVPIGEYLKKKLQNRLYGALLSAFLFQGMMLTSASLISMF